MNNIKRPFVINNDSLTLEDKDIELLITKIISNSVDLKVYFQNQAVDSYVCAYLNEKAEIVYDLMHGPAYLSPNKSLVYLRSNINNYGIYAVENLLSEAEMWNDQQDF